MHIYVNVTAKGSPSGTATTTIITYSSSIEKDNIAHESKEMKKRRGRKNKRGLNKRW